MDAHDADIVVQILTRAKCLRVEATASGATIEFPPKEFRAKRTYFSSDASRRENQRSYHWFSSVQAFLDLRVPWTEVAVRGRWLAPYRRRVWAEIQFKELRRVNDAVDRVRVGILETLLDPELVEQFESQSGRQQALELLDALARWDYVTLAQLAESDVEIRDALRAALGITDDELAAMALLDVPEWHALGDENGVFPKYYAKGQM